jgi:hypothetical protein
MDSVNRDPNDANTLHLSAADYIREIVQAAQQESTNVVSATKARKAFLTIKNNPQLRNVLMGLPPLQNPPVSMEIITNYHLGYLSSYPVTIVGD